MKTHLEIQIPIVVFKDEEDSIWYAHCPVLEITGYGESKGDAKKSFDIMLEETITYMVNHGTLDQELQRLGWEKTTIGQIPPGIETLLEKDAELRRMMVHRHSLTYSPVPAMA